MQHSNTDEQGGRFQPDADTTKSLKAEATNRLNPRVIKLMAQNKVQLAIVKATDMSFADRQMLSLLPQGRSN